MNARGKKKSKSRRGQRDATSTVAAEERTSLVATVFWMLCVLATLGAEATALMSWLLARHWPPAASSAPLRAFAGMMWFSALVSGLLVLVMTVVVYRVRKDKPPRAITVLAVVVGLVPLAILLVVGIAAAMGL